MNLLYLVGENSYIIHIIIILNNQNKINYKDTKRNQSQNKSFKKNVIMHSKKKKQSEIEICKFKMIIPFVRYS